VLEVIGLTRAYGRGVAAHGTLEHATLSVAVGELMTISSLVRGQAARATPPRG
jgi:hypothetical protein